MINKLRKLFRHEAKRHTIVFDEILLTCDEMIINHKSKIVIIDNIPLERNIGSLVTFDYDGGYYKGIGEVVYSEHRRSKNSYLYILSINNYNCI